MSNAAFYNLPKQVVADMDADMNVAAASVASAADLWAYPGKEWQHAFEEGWLRERGYTDAAEKAAERHREVVS